MIKVHCFVSCVCEVIKKTPGVDHRPYYFGVWDADFDVLEGPVLSYHSEKIDHTFFKNWYELLYGIKLHQWYEEGLSKEENVQRMLHLIENKPSHRHVMVMLDLSMLPERENKFHQRPFPHYVMLDTTENEDEWFMFDPDFRWEGVLPKDKILAAIQEPSVKGGYYFDADQIIPTSPETIEAYFNTCLKHDKNPMTDAVRFIVEAYTTGREQQRLKELTMALKQLPVLAIRKYAYEHAYAYFWELLGYEEEEFEAWCDEIELLVKGYTTVQYRAMKIAMTGNLEETNEIYKKLDELDEREFKIKRGLQKCFDEWCQQRENRMLIHN
ncbi:DUF6005 family protein [Metabacillus iocasae]|uniref:Petrobactin biosynthesis protein AsbE n=1 Tax=Priestia iocasae TaxID=2291674 RepID=A0ABS2R0M4_9BACI|nr:DUF6005 family protein [Metabacillus iocasae]MBM7704551.1 hypothetical protein [Metabacillus iocasae]